MPQDRWYDPQTHTTEEYGFINGSDRIINCAKLAVEAVNNSRSLGTRLSISFDRFSSQTATACVRCDQPVEKSFFDLDRGGRPGPFWRLIYDIDDAAKIKTKNLGSEEAKALLEAELRGVSVNMILRTAREQKLQWKEALREIKTKTPKAIKL